MSKNIAEICKIVFSKAVFRLKSYIFNGKPSFWHEIGSENCVFSFLLLVFIGIKIEASKRRERLK